MGPWFSMPSKLQGARREEDRVVIARGHGQISAARIVRCGHDHAGHIADGGRDLGLNHAEFGTSHDHVLEDVRRDAERFEDLLVPVFRACVQE